MSPNAKDTLNFMEDLNDVQRIITEK